MALPSYFCVCFNLSVEESLTHLFLHCPFAQGCWSTIGLNVEQSNPFTTLDILRNQLNVPFFHGGDHPYVMENLDAAK